MLGRRSLRDALALASLLVLCAAPARGQFRPPEPAPTPQEPAPTPQEPAATPPDQRVPPAEPGAPGPTDIRGERPGGWQPLIVLEGVYEQNVGFSTPPGPNDTLGSIQASLSRWRRTPRGDVRLTLEGAGFAYNELSNRNRVDGGGALEIRSRLTHRMQGGLKGRFKYAHSDTESSLIENAVLLPLVRTISYGLDGNLSWRLGDRTTWILDAGWRRIDFDSDTLLDTQTWTAGTSLARRLSEGESLSLHAMLVRIEDSTSTRNDPSASLALSSQLSRRVSLDLSAGAGSTQTVTEFGPQPREWSAQAAASLTVSVRNGQLSLRYEHGLRPTTGLGITELTDLVGVRAVLPIGRKLELLARGSFAFRGKAENAGARRSREADAFAGAALRLARRLRFVAGYRFRHVDDPLLGAATRNNRASLSLAWGPESLGAGR